MENGNTAEKKFVNFAHRGASEYAPENTALAFNLGVFMGANGIETDVWMTKDGVAVLFHDDTLERVTGEKGSITDYTYEELLHFRVRKGNLTDRIITLEAFLRDFGWRDLTFAIELKGPGAEKTVADMIKKFDVESNCTVTSFEISYLKNIHKYAPALKLGYLTSRYDDELMEELRVLGIREYCPEAKHVTRELVNRWHENGFYVRAWGVFNEDLMRNAYYAGVDGMTLNFPDRFKSISIFKCEKGKKK